jgi:hypothetical protein
MANTTAPRSNRFKGWFFDAVNGQLEYWYNGTKVGGIDASGHDIGTGDSGSFMQNSIIGTAGLSSAQKLFANVTAASIASNGANATVPTFGLFASAAAVIDRAFAVNIVAADVTTGTATSSASYRRVTLICNTAASGTGTDIVASLNATASAAAGASRGFTIAASTIPAGGYVIASQLTVGAATADGTDAAAREYWVEYHYV